MARYSAAEYRRRRRLKYGTTMDKLHAAFTSSEIQAKKSKARKEARDTERKEYKAAKKKQDRMLQLAGMPKGRGEKELKRLAQGGSLKESETEKKTRQRKEQLKAMPKGRGTKLLKKMEAAEKKDYKPTPTQPSPSAQAKQSAKPKKQVVTNPTVKTDAQKQAAAAQKRAQEAAKKAQEDAKKRMADAAKKLGVKK